MGFRPSTVANNGSKVLKGFQGMENPVITLLDSIPAVIHEITVGITGNPECFLQEIEIPYISS